MGIEHKLVVSPTEIDRDLLPEACGPVGSDDFKIAVRNLIERIFDPFAEWVHVSFEANGIELWWRDKTGETDGRARAIRLLEQGSLGEGVQLLKLLVPLHTSDPVLFYNLGLALSDMGRLSESENDLRHALELQSDSVNTMVALGVALHRQGKTTDARRVLEQACAKDETNPYALRNLAGCLLSLGAEQARAVELLRKATGLLPSDQQAWLGLAQALEQKGDLSEADSCYTKVIEINPYTSFSELAMRARTRFAGKGFQARSADGLRMDAVMYCISAMDKFAQKSRKEVEQVGFEIAMLGRKGINPNDPDKRYKLRSLPGTFSGLQLLCYMYVAWKAIESNMDIGFDLKREYETALSLQSGKKPEPGKSD